jgi:hypothetical protein
VQRAKCKDFGRGSSKFKDLGSKNLLFPRGVPHEVRGGVFFVQSSKLNDLVRSSI